MAEIIDEDVVLCPRCGGELERVAGLWLCDGCGGSFEASEIIERSD